MANIAINPTCKLETAYFLPDVAGTITSAEFERLRNLIETSGKDVGSNMTQIVLYADAAQFGSNLTIVTASLEFIREGNYSIDIMVNKNNILIAQYHVVNYSPLFIQAYQWYHVNAETEEYTPVTTEQTINVNASTNGVTSYTDAGGRVFTLDQSLNAELLPYIYMKGEAPTPTEEDFKYYIDRVRKFIVRMAGKKVSEGE